MAEVEPNPNGLPVLRGHFCVFNRWTEIDSYWEGRFLEMIAPGAARKTLRDRRGKIRCLFQHGHDFYIGDKPLGPFRDLREDDEGVYYEVPLLDTNYVAELIPGLDEELYGASFRMRVMRDTWDEAPGESEHNPDGIPERVIKEYALWEGGPVTFGAYDDATAKTRSLTDGFMFDGLAQDPERFKGLVAFAEDIAKRRRPERAADDADGEGAPSDAPQDDSTAPEADVEALADDTAAGEPAADDGDRDGADDTTSSRRETPAPPKDSAGTESHPDHGRRDDTPVQRTGFTRGRALGVLPPKSGPPSGVLPGGHA